MESDSKKVVLAALFGNSLITVSKFIAAGLSGSSAMLAEGLHSIADTGNQLLLLLGMKRAKKPADTIHPFGYGQESFFWAFLVGMSMFVIGAAFSIYHGVERLMHPAPLERLTVSYVVLILSFFFEGYSWSVAFREMRKVKGNKSFWAYLKETRTPAILVVFLEDSAAMLGLLIALAGLTAAHVTGNVMFDGIASIVIGVILAAVAYIVSFEMKSLLIGEGVGKEKDQALRQAICAVPGVAACLQCLTMFLSPNRVLVNVQVHIEDHYDTDGVEQVIDRIEEAVVHTLSTTENLIFVEAAAGPDTEKTRVKLTE